MKGGTKRTHRNTKLEKIGDEKREREAGLSKLGNPVLFTLHKLGADDTTARKG